MVWRASRSAASTLAGLALTASCTATPLFSSPIPGVEVASPTFRAAEVPLTVPSPSPGVPADELTSTQAAQFALGQVPPITRENVTGIGRFAILGGKDYSYLGQLAFSPDSRLLAVVHGFDLENRVTIWGRGHGNLAADTFPPWPGRVAGRLFAGWRMARHRVR